VRLPLADLADHCRKSSTRRTGNQTNFLQLKGTIDSGRQPDRSGVPISKRSGAVDGAAVAPPVEDGVPRDDPSRTTAGSAAPAAS
jgi:hypothetical protein